MNYPDKFITEIKSINKEMDHLWNKKKRSVNDFLLANMDSPWESVLKSLAEVDKISAIKLHYDYMGTSLMSSKRFIESLLD